VTGKNKRRQLPAYRRRIDDGATASGSRLVLKNAGRGRIVFAADLRQLNAMRILRNYLLKGIYRPLVMALGGFDVRHAV